MNAAERIARLRAANPAAVDLALVCALAARVEPTLLRRFRLLLPHADAAAEADLWFSDLLAGRDATAIALDPLVAEALREELRRPERAELREAAAGEICDAHAGAHWSVRLEERIRYLHVAQSPDADEEIDDLLLAALDQLRTEPDARGVARWLLGAAGRLPRQITERTVGRASAAAAMLHLDRQAPPTTLLNAGESQVWLPWLADVLPRVSVPVQLLDGAVVLGSRGPDAVLLPDVPDTNPLVIEVRWCDGARTVSQQARFRLDEPVQVETGTRVATLVTLTGAAYDLAADYAPGEVTSAGLRFDHIMQALRPCLGREKELSELKSALRNPSVSWLGITGRPGSGTSTLLVAAADAARADGIAVIEHFFTPETQDEASIRRSCLAQLEECYSEEFRRLPPTATDPDAGLEATLGTLAELKAFRRRPLIIVLDNLQVERGGHRPAGQDRGGRLVAAFDRRGQSPLSRPPFPDWLPAGARYIVTVSSLPEVRKDMGVQPLRVVELSRQSDRRVCLAMIEQDRATLKRAFASPIDRMALAELADDLPARLGKILRWVARQPAGTVTTGSIPRILTVFWPKVRGALESQFGEDSAAELLDILRAAHGRHTWQDCVDDHRWPEFWQACLTAKLVTDVPPDGIVELTAPTATEILLDSALSGDRYLGLRDETPPMFAHTASPTRVAAAVDHALAIGDLTTAYQLCTDLTMLRRRYAEDALALLTDLDTVATALDQDGSFTLSMTSTDPRSLTADLTSLHSIVQHIYKAGIPPAEFAPALYDRLAQHDILRRAVPDFASESAPLPPLRVRQMLSEQDIRTSTRPLTSPGPVLAIARLADVQINTLAGPEDVVLITRSDLRTIDGTVLISEWSNAVGAARGRSGGFALWTTDSVWIDDRMKITSNGPIDHAEQLETGLAIADRDGGVTIIPTGLTIQYGRWLPGHGARVTAIIEVTLVVRTIEVVVACLVASEDGTIRMPSPTGTDPQTFAGHRAAVRALVDCRGQAARRREPYPWMEGHGQSTFVSGADDGCLLEWRFDDPTHPVSRWQGTAAITCLDERDGTIMFGTADGQVGTWNPDSGESTTLGSHIGPVRGITVLSDSLVVSWAGSVRFWDLRRPGPLTDNAIGFPGGVRDVLLGKNTYTVLCGDNSVQRRPRPDLAPAAEHSERTCLEIVNGIIHTGLDDKLVQVFPDALLDTAHDGGPFVRAVALNGSAAAAIDRHGWIRYVPPQAPPDGTPPTVDLIAADRADRVATATGQVINAWEMNTAGNIDMFDDNLLRIASRDAPAQVTSLTMSRLGLIVAGLANSNTMVFDSPSLQFVRTLTGRGTPITAVAALPDGTVLTGSSAGVIQCWPADSAHGPVTYPQRAGRITAMAVVEPWLITAGEDGAILLWATNSPRPVHEINIGAPVVALAAEAKLVAARDTHGRLWTFDLDPPQTELSPPQHLTAQIQETEPNGTMLVELTDLSNEPYEITAIRASINGQTAHIATRMPWPLLEPDGTFIVPSRPLANQPLIIACTTADIRRGGLSSSLKLKINVASRRILGYRTHQTLELTTQKATGRSVFLSYVHGSDSDAYVKSLAAYLTNAGVPVWLDKSSIMYGDRLDRVIADSIDTCAAVIVVMTPEAQKSAWVSIEIGLALDRNKPIIPLLLRGSPLHGLSDIQYEDVTGGRMPSARLVSYLRELISIRE